MPQRTNDFQELVTLIGHAFAKPGDKVRPSVMVTELGLEEDDRKIDIFREIPGGLYSIKVAVEVKDEKRPMDIIKFDSYYAKYRGEGRRCSVPLRLPVVGGAEKRREK